MEFRNVFWGSPWISSMLLFWLIFCARSPRRVSISGEIGAVGVVKPGRGGEGRDEQREGTWAGTAIVQRRQSGGVPREKTDDEAEEVE